MCKEDWKNRDQLSLSFCGCGFMCMYHAGVCAAVKEFAPHLLKVPILGASAGAIVGACIASDVCISQTISVALDVVASARSFTFGALNRDFDLMRIIRKDLDLVLPENAHKLCTGRLHVSLTRSSDFSNLLVSEFHSKQELIDVIVCSCFIPGYVGFNYPKYLGERYVDGGISVNQPILDYNTITVSPFAGESDICPSDADSANLLGLMFAGTSIRFSINNMMRIFMCLFPPPPDACSKICQQGFEDALRYLFLNGYSPCGNCLILQADLMAVEAGSSSTAVEAVTVTPAIEARPSPTVARPPVRRVLKRRKGSECRLCLQIIDPLVKPPFTQLFPRLIKQAFDDALKAQEAYRGFFYSWRIVRLAKYLLLPALFCLQLFKFSKSIGVSLASYAFNDWFLATVKLAVKTLLREIIKERNIASTTLEGVQVEVPELSSLENEKRVSETALNMEQSRIIMESENPLTESDLAVSQERLAPIGEEASSYGLSEADNNWIFCNQDCYFKNLEQTETHENVLAFYYLDERLRAQFCQVHGVDHDSMLKAIGLENPTAV